MHQSGRPRPTRSPHLRMERQERKGIYLTTQSNLHPLPCSHRIPPRRAARAANIGGGRRKAPRYVFACKDPRRVERGRSPMRTDQLFRLLGLGPPRGGFRPECHIFSGVVAPRAEKRTSGPLSPFLV